MGFLPLRAQGALSPDFLKFSRSLLSLHSRPPSPEGWFGPIRDMRHSRSSTEGKVLALHAAVVAMTLVPRSNPQHHICSP